MLKIKKRIKVAPYVWLSITCLSLAACVQTPVQQSSKSDSLIELSKQLPLGHEVRRGERLQDIAKHYQQSISQLIAWNQLRPPYQVKVGQVLQVSDVGGGWKVLRARGQEKQLSAEYLQQISSLKPMSDDTLRAHAWQWPTRGKLERTHSKTGRRGVTIYGKYQQAIHASAEGEVLYSGKGLTGYDGHLIILRHPSACLSVYAHNQAKAAIAKGAKVQAGDPIARMGYNSQRRPSLQFEISCAEKTLDPLSLLPDVTAKYP